MKQKKRRQKKLTEDILSRKICGLLFFQKIAGADISAAGKVQYGTIPLFALIQYRTVLIAEKSAPNYMSWLLNAHTSIVHR